MVKGSQFEYDSRHWRHNIHVAPLADNQTYSAATIDSDNAITKDRSLEKNNKTECNKSLITLCDNNNSL